AAQSTSGKIEATSDYTDETGNKVVHQTVRYPGGSTPRFRQRRPDGNGGWIWNLNGIRPVLYRLPDVIAAVAAGQTIHIVEGEKDADNLRDLGLVATTNAMGAGKWNATYNEVLRGADVVIIGDNDEPGRKHVQDVARQLTLVAKRLRVLDLAAHWKECPVKADVSDWIDTGADTNQLIAWIDTAPDWS